MLINQNSINIKYINIYSLTKEKISIPIFQRFYEWKDKQFQEFLNDLKSCLTEKDKQIYLLDFIWYKEENKIKLADGQQRIVTLNLLIKAFKECAIRYNLNIQDVDFFDISYDNCEYQEIYNRSFSSSPIRPFKKMYTYLLNFVIENKEYLNEFINIIKNNVFIYMKEADSTDSAYDIFTQINTGGMRLGKTEVIQTAINQYSNIYNIKLEENGDQLSKAISSYYKLINKASNSKFDTIAIMSFLKDYIVSDKQEFSDFANKLKKISKMYTYPIYYIVNEIGRSQLIDILNIMMMLNIDINKKRDYLCDIMFPLCLLSIVMSMKRSNPGGNIVSLYNNVIELIKSNESSANIGNYIATFINSNEELCKINFQEFNAALGKKGTKIGLKKALLIMDVIWHNTSSNLDLNRINLEHIYPQNPEPKWAMNGWPTSSEDRINLVDNIGNYLLLNESVNKKIQNKYIDAKVVEYNKIIPNDLTLQTTINTVDFELFKKERENYIYKRQMNICEQIYEIFPSAKVIIKK